MGFLFPVIIILATFSARLNSTAHFPRRDPRCAQRGSRCPAPAGFGPTTAPPGAASSPRAGSFHSRCVRACQEAVKNAFMCLNLALMNIKGSNSCVPLPPELPSCPCPCPLMAPHCCPGRRRAFIARSVTSTGDISQGQRRCHKRGVLGNKQGQAARILPRAAVFCFPCLCRYRGRDKNFMLLLARDKKCCECDCCPGDRGKGE